MTPARSTPSASTTRRTHIETGRAGEDLIADLLERAGWRILNRNWRPGRVRHRVRGELDLVAERDGRVVVFEVKTRTGTGFGHPAEAVTPDKLRRLHLLARTWAAEHGVRPVPDVDVVCVQWSRGQAPRVEHLGSLSWH